MNINSIREEVKFQGLKNKDKDNKGLKIKLKRIYRRRWLYIMVLPGIVYYIIFKYVPMFGIIIAFKDYNPFIGILKSPWVGFTHFQRFFSISSFYILLRNTLLLFIYSLIFYFPAPIILALLLNELKNTKLKRTVQTVIYLPHFISWVVIMGITYVFFSPVSGVITNLLKSWGIGEVNILMDPRYFRGLIIGQQIWKEAGWGTIIFLAALTSIPVKLYESAIIDGANRWKQVRYITLPSLKFIIVTLLILRMGDILDSGFTQLFLMTTATTREVGDVFDTYIYRNGIENGLFSYTTAIGLFKSVVGLIFILFSNYLVKKIGEEGIF